MATDTAPRAHPDVPAVPTVTATGVDEPALRGLRRWNVALAVLHAAQAIAVLVLASGFAIAVTLTSPTGPPGSPISAPETVFDVRIGWAIAAFLGLAALDHLLTGTVLRGRYEAGLRAGINRFRWVEYSVSATIMVLLICMYSGITGLDALIAVAGANVAMILFGWLQESTNPPGTERVSMKPFWFGTVAGLAPWVALAVVLARAEEIPGFVIGIFVSLFLFFWSFGLNQWLQYRQVGRWASYAFGEKVYLVLSLAAKSALAWQIFAGSLAT
jgi:hypothetical protein